MQVDFQSGSQLEMLDLQMPRIHSNSVIMGREEKGATEWCAWNEWAGKSSSLKGMATLFH